MLSRALILATVLLSFGPSVIVPAKAQNLDAGKSPSQIFSSTCSACHRSQRGLLKTVPPGSLPGFLREHYTTSRDMAQQLSAYLLSNGATDNRIGGGRLTKQGEDARSGAAVGSPEAAPAPGRRDRNRPQDAAAPDFDGMAPAEPRTSRTKRGRVAPAEAAPGPDGQPPVAAEAPPARPKPVKGKKKGHEEPPKATPAVDTAKPADTKPADTKPSEPAKSETKSEPAKDEVKTPDTSKPEAAPTVETPKSEAEKPAPAVEPLRPDPSKMESPPAARPPEPKPVEPSSSPAAPTTRPDPVPPVTPAPPPATPSPSSSAPSETRSAPADSPPSSEPPRPTISVTPPPPPPPAPTETPVPPISK